MTDKELLEEYFERICSFRETHGVRGLHGEFGLMRDAFLAACEIKNKKIKELEARLDKATAMIVNHEAKMIFMYEALEKLSKLRRCELCDRVEIAIEALDKIGKNTEIIG